VEMVDRLRPRAAPRASHRARKSGREVIDRR
jgi:hypothetical protein